MIDVNKNLSWSDLPQGINDWLASETVTTVIMDINRRLNLTGERGKVIAWGVGQLVTKKWAAKNFTSELMRWLKLSNEMINIATQEIHQKIFKPIAKPLLNDLSININDIYQESGGVTIKSPAQATSSTTSQPAMPLKSAATENHEEEHPFVIYHEGMPKAPQPSAPQTPVIKPTMPLMPPPPSNVVDLRNRMPLRPTPPVNQPGGPTATRIVNYSNYLTPIDNSNSV